MKKLFSVVLATTLMFAAVGCGSSTTSEAPAADAGASEEVATEEAMTIGLVLPTLTTEFFVTIKETAEAYAAETGLNIVILDSQDDAVKQSSNVEDLITKKVDGILLIPTDSDAVATAVEDLNAAGIPVITLDRSANGGEVLSHIASDNVAGGVMAGEYIVELLGGAGKVVELEGVPGASATRERGEGFNIAMDAAGIEVVARQTANFSKAEGLTVMENILQAQPEIDAVFAHNDEMALGAMEAIDAAGRSGEIKIVGFDASADAVAAVAEGTMAATVAQKPDLMTTTGIETLLQAIAGETVPESVPVELALVAE
ncbi:substrate-binding domain-containing protein [Chakrabartyella piscis]|uniref:substrate-binding domain-containing protein n=1 Tax=Chakrabartyella piscis TaxID=2918914 RepID=UPI002958966F|nr:substrate-binding domain-containing protein [Chakrabartyella piscis]